MTLIASKALSSHGAPCKFKAFDAPFTFFRTHHSFLCIMYIKMNGVLCVMCHFYVYILHLSLFVFNVKEFSFIMLKREWGPILIEPRGRYI